KLGPISDDEMDVELLQGYLDFCRDDLSFARRLEICSQIIKLSPKVSDHLQYGSLRGFCYGEVGDFEQATKEFASAIAYARMEEKRKSLSLRARELLAGALIMHGVF